MRTLIGLLIVISAAAHADLSIFEVRKTLAMSDGDPVFRDFYINGGSEAGLTAGMVITVNRRMPLYDTYQNRSAGDLDIKVAKVKIIHVQRGLAVARLHAEFTRDNAPLLEDNFIMVGDRLDLATASADEGDKEKGEKGKAPKGKSAAEAKNEESPEVAAAPQIVVNSVELSSTAPTPVSNPEPAAPQENVQAPVLQ